MIVLDANLLLYAYDANAPQHEPARRHIENIFSDPGTVALPMQSISAFLRISTHRGLLRPPYSMSEAAGFVDEWLSLPHVRLLVPGDRYWEIFRGLLKETHISGRSVTDAEIAALTMEYGGELHTCDRDFARFPHLRWRNPLAKR